MDIDINNVNNINNDFLNNLNDNDEINTSNNNSNFNIYEKKKRGRKPKNYIPDDNINDNTINNKILKKRGRKPTGKIIEMTKTLNVSDLSFSECLIAHLKIDKKDIDKIININTNNEISYDIKYNDNIDNNKNNEILYELKSNNIVNNNKKLENLQFNINNLDKIDIKTIQDKIDTNKIEFENINLNKTENINLNKTELDNNNFILTNLENDKNNFKENSFKIIEKKIIKSNIDLFDYNNNIWQQKTDINCWWCCHQFNTIPLGIPIQFVKNKFYLYGCFCSFNCSLSYNLDMNDYKIWDRQCLIYYMKNIIDPENDIILKPAPPKQILTKFGGIISIDEYRNSLFSLHTDYKYILPQMISIATYIEEYINKPTNNININNTTNTNTNYVLKRNKPLSTKNKLYSINF